MLLGICGGLAALFVSAARTPTRRSSPRRYVLVLIAANTSCDPPPAPLPAQQCIELRKEVKGAARLGTQSLSPPPRPPLGWLLSEVAIHALDLDVGLRL